MHARTHSHTHTLAAKVANFFRKNSFVSESSVLSTASRKSASAFFRSPICLSAAMRCSRGRIPPSCKLSTFLRMARVNSLSPTNSNHGNSSQQVAGQSTPRPSRALTLLQHTQYPFYVQSDTVRAVGLARSLVNVGQQVWVCCLGILHKLDTRMGGRRSWS